MASNLPSNPYGQVSQTGFVSYHDGASHYSSDELAELKPEPEVKGKKRAFSKVELPSRVNSPWGKNAAPEKPTRTRKKQKHTKQEESSSTDFRLSPPWNKKGLIHVTPPIPRESSHIESAEKSELVRQSLQLDPPPASGCLRYSQEFQAERNHTIRADMSRLSGHIEGLLRRNRYLENELTILSKDNYALREDSRYMQAELESLSKENTSLKNLLTVKEINDI